MDLSSETRIARATALAKLLAGATLSIRSGAKPASCEAAGGSEIASLELPGNISVKGDTITVIAAPVRGLSKARGVPGHIRVEKAGKCVLQAAVGVEFPMAQEEIEQGQMIEVRSWSIVDGDM